jgi:hypothetical protein
MVSIFFNRCCKKTCRTYGAQYLLLAGCYQYAAPMGLLLAAMELVDIPGMLGFCG